MNLLRWLSLAATLGAFAVIVLGGYVSASGAGLACPDWPTCYGSLIPPFDRPNAVVEWTHRLAALVEGFITLGLVALVWWKHREHRDLLAFSSFAFALLVIQTILGMVAVGSQLHPAIVTLHLATAVAFFGMVLLTAVLIWWPRIPAKPPAPGQPTPEGRD